MRMIQAPGWITFGAEYIKAKLENRRARFVCKGQQLKYLYIFQYIISILAPNVKQDESETVKLKILADVFLFLIIAITAFSLSF